MLHLIFLLLIGLGGGGSGGSAAPAAVAEAAPLQADAPQYVAEPQQPTGKFTTAVEVKPILTATKPQWVALREYDGRDLLYVTQILSWRCGLVGLEVGINGAPPEVWPLPECLEDGPMPNAITGDEGVVYKRYDLGSVSDVSVRIIYDDLTEDSASYPRASILMP